MRGDCESHEEKKKGTKKGPKMVIFEGPKKGRFLIIFRTFGTGKNAAEFYGRRDATTLHSNDYMRPRKRHLLNK